MKIALFYHSLISDWNHGNAHFLRGVASELCHRGHEVTVYEPEDSWSARHLLAEHGTEPIEEFQRLYPHLHAHRYQSLDLDQELEGVDLVIVHEWSDPALVARLGRYRHHHPDLRLFFHDTHHRAVTAPHELAGYDLQHYDGVLAYGEVLRRLYLQHGWCGQAWTWHEAADLRRFHPQSGLVPERDLVWIGNWGDGERGAELHEFLIDPCRELNLSALVHGVRYPACAVTALAAAGIEYGGWLPNFAVPDCFARSRVTVHVPRRPYVKLLPGIPTIRPFEALACGIPMVTAYWDDAEHLFTPGEDYLVARSGKEMTQHLRAVLHEPDLARRLAEHGLATIRRRHTCVHRVNELLEIFQSTHGPESRVHPHETISSPVCCPA